MMSNAAPSAAHRGRSLLVTGGAGFLGSNFVHYWVAQHPGDTVVVLDALTYAGCRASLVPLEESAAITFVHGNVLDSALLEALMERHRVDTIVHFAAESHVDRSIASADAFVVSNILGTQRLIDVARAAWQINGIWREGVRFHQISTDEVYGDIDPLAAPVSESAPYRPSSPYSASKAAADHLVRAAGRTHGLPFSISHCANNYGPRQFPEKLIPVMILNALHGRPLPLYGDGQQLREWIHVDDHSRALDAILHADVRGESFNIGGTRDVTNQSIVEGICRVLDAEFASDRKLGERYPRCPAARGERCAVLITNVADRPGHDRRYAIDASRLRKRLGIESSMNLEDGLAATVRWYLENDAWWRPLVPASS